MPTPTFQPPQGQQSTAQLQDWIIKLVRDLNYMLGNLDTLNVNRLDAKVIIAQTITALQISANAITADKLSVTQLSAITANMGTLTAGSITTNAQVNIGTDATVGNSLYVGQNNPTNDSVIALNGGAALQSNRGAGSVTMTANGDAGISCGTTMTLFSAGSDVVIHSQSGKVSLTCPGGFWVNGVKIAP
jgi:hypothetical protein